MKLIDLLVRELKHWPDDVHCMTQDSDGDLNWHNNKSTPELNDKGVTWKCDGSWMDYHRGWEISDDWKTEIVTRDQYEAALADKNDGWIEWGGGECPVEEGTLVDIRDGDGHEWHGVKAAPKDEYSDAASTFWEHKGSPRNNIIAYRLHKPDINSRASDDRLEQDLNECIGQDVVNHPSHYTKGNIECIDAIDSATTGKSGIEAVCVANVIKYLWRYEEKNGLEDVKKAQWYLNKLISELESK